MRMNNKSHESITINKQDIEDVTCHVLTKWCLIITGQTDEDIHVLSPTGKACSAFNALGSISRSRERTAATKIRVINSNIKSVLLDGSETWRPTMKIMSKLQTSVNRCLHRILCIYWPSTLYHQCISNLLDITGQTPVK